jgi:hypothetical protein
MSAERPRLLVPGLLPADPALERYRVHPGAVTAVELDPGDVLTVIDADGRQRGELTVLAGGAEDYSALGTEADTAATILRSIAARSALQGAAITISGAGFAPNELVTVTLSLEKIKNPVHPAQLKSAVMAQSDASWIRSRVGGNHRLQTWRVRQS